MEQDPPPLAALKKAISVAGTTYALAELLNYKQSRISMWVTRGRVPAEECRAVEQATGGQVTRHDLRPDVFGQAVSQGPVSTSATEAA